MYCICVYGSDGKESVCNVGDPHLIPGSGRSPGEGTGYPLQYSCLENSMDKGAWQSTVHEVAKCQTWLRDQHLHSASTFLMRSSRDAIKAPGVQRELTMYSYTRLQQCQQKKGKWLSKTRVTKSRGDILSLTQGTSCNEQDKGLFHMLVFLIVIYISI